MDSENFPLPEWDQWREHTLSDDRGRSRQFNGTLAGAQNAARILSKKHGVGIAIRTRGELVAYLNTSNRETLAPYDAPEEI